MKIPLWYLARFGTILTWLQNIAKNNKNVLRYVCYIATLMGLKLFRILVKYNNRVWLNRPFSIHIHTHTHMLYIVLMFHITSFPDSIFRVFFRLILYLVCNEHTSLQWNFLKEFHPTKKRNGETNRKKMKENTWSERNWKLIIKHKSYGLW